MAIYNPLSNVVEQTLEPRIMYHTNTLSKCWKRIAPNPGGGGNVQKPGYSKDWVLRRLFKTGLAGTFRFGNLSDRSFRVDSTSLTTANPNFNILGEQAGDVWQSESPMPAYFTYQTPLGKGVGNMHAEVEFLRSDEQDANKASIMADIVDGTAKKVALFMCNAFLAETDTLTCQAGRIATFEACVLGKFSPASITDTAGNVTDGITFNGTLDHEDNAITVTLLGHNGSAGGAIRRFQEGQEVDLIACVATDHRFARLNPASSPVYVNISDGGNSKITLINTTGGNITIPASTVGGATINYVLIVPHGALGNQTWASTAANQSISADVNASGTTYISTLPFGVERFLKGSGGLCGTSTNHVTTATPSNSISLTRFPDYKSYVEAVGGPLDERALISKAAKMDVAGLTEDDMFDEAWMTPGVFANYVDNLDGFYQWERNGRGIDLSKQGTGSSIGFSALGKSYTIEVDPFIGSGKVYGLITRGSNFKMQQPPRIQGSRSGAGLPSGVEFLVPKLNPGANDIWQGAKATSGTGSHATAGQTTSYMEAPFWYPYQIMPERFRGMKLSTVTETYGPAF